MFGKNKTKERKIEKDIREVETIGDSCTHIINTETESKDYPPVKVIQICQLLPDDYKIRIKFGHRYTYYKGKVMFVPPEMYDWDIRDISIWESEVGVFVDSNEKYNEIADNELKKKISEHYAHKEEKKTNITPLSEDDLFNLASDITSPDELSRVWEEHKDDKTVLKFICMNPNATTILLKRIYEHFDAEDYYGWERKDLVKQIARHINIDDSLAWVIYCDCIDDVWLEDVIRKSLINNISISESLREKISVGTKSANPEKL